MAQYDNHFFERRMYNPWFLIDEDLNDNEKFDKLYKYVLELEERIEQLEAK